LFPDAKRLLGLPVNDPGLQAAFKECPFKVVTEFSVRKMKIGAGGREKKMAAPEVRKL
jgi:hypothetical protein